MNTIEEALEDLVSGKIIIVMDDEERENEGDLIHLLNFALQKLLISCQLMQKV